MAEPSVQLFLGRDVVRRALALYGSPMRTLQMSGVLTVTAVVVAVGTHWFARARATGHIAIALIILTGMLAAAPLVLIALIWIVNIGIVVTAVTLVLLFSLLWVPLIVLRWLLK